MINVKILEVNTLSFDDWIRLYWLVMSTWFEFKLAGYNLWDASGYLF